MVFGGFRQMMMRFDNNGWKGTYRSGSWRVSNGGYDLWFEIYFDEKPVAQCIAGVVTSHFRVAGIDNEKLVDKIIEIFPHLKRENEN